MAFDNTKNSLSLAYLISKVNGVGTRALAVTKANELEARLHELQKENKILKLKLTISHTYQLTKHIHQITDSFYKYCETEKRSDLKEIDSDLTKAAITINRP